jgi:hypothetical protein
MTFRSNTVRRIAADLERNELPSILKLSDIRLDEMDPREVAAYGFLLERVTNTNGVRLDANETAILTRQLEFVRTKVFEVRYAALLSLQFLPLMTDLPAWISNVIQVVYDGFGQARIIGNAGSDDIPRVGVTVSEQSVKVVSVAAEYAYQLMELRAAIGAGVPLTDKKAKLARRIVDAALDELLATGSLAAHTLPQANTGMTGFVNSSAVPTFTATAGSWAAATADVLCAEVNNFIASVSQQTNQIFSTTDVVLSPTKYDLLAAKPRSSGTDTTCLEFLQKVNKGVTFSKWHRLTNAGTGGTVDRLIAYQKDPEVVEGIVPITFEQLPPEVHGFETSVICHARCGGVDWHQPKGAAYLNPAN